MSEKSNDVLMSGISQRLRELRETKGVTMREMAKQCGISVTTANFLLNGGLDTCRLKTLITVAQYFDVSLDQLVFGKGYISPWAHKKYVDDAFQNHVVEVYMRSGMTEEEAIAAMREYFPN